MIAPRPTTQFKQFVRSRYAWPGGYPMFAVMSDGECLCHTCAKDNAKLVLRATRDADRSDWDCAGVCINYEDTNLQCANCNKLLESAYN